MPAPWDFAYRLNVVPSFFFKGRLSATGKVLHLASFLKRKFMELGKTYLLLTKVWSLLPKLAREGGGVLLGILGGVVPDPISDQKMSFSTPVFRPDL